MTMVFSSSVISYTW